MTDAQRRRPGRAEAEDVTLSALRDAARPGAGRGHLAVTQVLGAAGRLGAGAWPDRAASGIGPPVRIAAAVGGTFLVAASSPGCPRSPQ